MSRRGSHGAIAFAALMISVAGTVAGCGTDSTTGSTGATASTGASASTAATTAVSAATSESETTVTAPTSPGSGPIDAGLQALIDAATTDLVGRLAAAATDVHVVTAKSMTWPDKSIGCPKPGIQYLQVLVDGALIELQVAGKMYSYHSGDDAKPALCEQTLTGQAIPPATS